MNPEEVIVKVSLGLKVDDRFLIISDKDNAIFGKKIRKVAEEICDIFYLEIEDFGNRPIVEYPEKMKEMIREFKPSASCYVATTRPGEVSFRISLINDLVKNYKVRHVHMPGLNEKIWNSGLKVDYNKVKEITMKILEITKEAREISVFNDLGTEIYVKGFYKWIPDTGIFHKQGEWGNLPAGEVFTCPKKIEGKFFAEVLGDYFIKYGKLREPVVFEIESSEVVDIRYKDDKLRKELEKYLFEGPENATRVGEFAIGTNIFLREIIGNLLQDEKFPGVHIAFGNPNPEMTGAPWDCEVHLDVISLKTTVVVDGEEIMKRGKFTISF